MHVAVLLLYCNDFPRRTSFTRDWAQAAVEVCGRYLADQSAGRVTFTWQVFDWIDVGLTEAAWVDLSSKGIGGVVTLVQPKLPPGTDLTTGFDHILVGIDSQNSSGGTTPGAFTYLGASNFTPSLMAHELGHRFGADDAFGSTGAIYENHYCVMGAMDWPYTTTVGALTTPDAPGLDQAGPHMSAPTLMATGWLDPTQHDVYTDLTGFPDVEHGGASVTLKALSGGPRPALNRKPVAVRYKEFVLEYRVPVPSGWDAGIPAGDGGSGWVVVHQFPQSAPRANFVTAFAASPGASASVGVDNVLDLTAPGPLVIHVVSADPGDAVVHLWLSQRPVREELNGRQLGGGAGGDGGGWVWTPGRGLRRIPPWSPLLGIAERISDVAALQELAARAPEADVQAITSHTTGVLQSLQEDLGRLPLTVGPPMLQIRSRLDTIEEANRSLAEQVAADGSTHELLDRSRAQLADLRRVVEQVARDRQG